jgi:hypothetical protein
MRWLQAAMQAAQRRYKLTNLLLLLLRCLALILLALALARPSLAGFGRGGRLVLVIDTTASMGPLGGSGGALAQVRNTLADAELGYQELVLVTVDHRVQVRERGDLAAIRANAASLVASAMPGGLNRATLDDELLTLMEVCDGESDVVLISDFRQDDGTSLATVLQERVRSVRRWRVGADGPNAIIGGVLDSDDLVPGMPGSLRLAITGPSESAQLAIGAGLPVPVTLARSEDRARVSLPPLDSGEHLLRLQLIDKGLNYDDLLELPIHVRSTVPAVVVASAPSRLEAALEADSARIDRRPRVHPSDAAVPLPAGGLLVAREGLNDSKRVASWTRKGGVLWTSAEQLQRDPVLAELAAGISVSDEALPGGPLTTGSEDIDTSLSRVNLEQVPVMLTTPATEVLLQAGDNPLVIAVPAGRGWVIIEALPIETDSDAAEQASLVNAGAFPLWIRRTVRTYTGRLHLPRQWQAGMPVPEAATLRRDGRELRLEAEEQLMAEPGLWRLGDHDEALVVLPNAAEGLLQHLADDADTEFAESLPEGRGADWGIGLLLAALAVLLIEGTIAAWAGRAYGS